MDNGIWLCRGCDGIVDRDAVRFSPETLKRIRREHTEFARLGTQVETEVGLVVIGPNVVAGGQVVRVSAAGIVLRLAFFLRGAPEDLYAFVHRFDSQPPLLRYILVSELGVGGLLAGVPEVTREGAAWSLTFQWLPEAPKLSAPEGSGMSRQTGEMISGEAYWKQTVEVVLTAPLGTWFADMEGGSYLSELYDTLRGSTWFEHVLKCELIRLTCIPAPGRIGRPINQYPPLPWVRQVFAVRAPHTKLVEGRLRLQLDLDLEGHGRWAAEVNIDIYEKPALRTERAKAAWMAENIRRIEKEGRALPTPLPPDGWDIDDGYPR